MPDEQPAPQEKPAAKTPETPKPVTDVLADRLGRHRMWNITLHLKRTGKARVVSQETIEQVKKFIHDNVLDTVLLDETKGIVVIRATKSGLEQAFSAKDERGRVAANGIRMVVVVVGGVRYRNIVGQLALPPGVTKVTGFDTRPAPEPEAKKAGPEGKTLG